MGTSRPASTDLLQTLPSQDCEFGDDVEEWKRTLKNSPAPEELKQTAEQSREVQDEENFSLSDGEGEDLNGQAHLKAELEAINSGAKGAISMHQPAAAQQSLENSIHSIQSSS